MKHIAKIFGIIVILFLINLGASNSNEVVFRLWPINYEFKMSLGICVSVIFLISFFCGGMFMWLNNTVLYKRNLKLAKKQIKDLEKKLNSAEKAEV